MQRVPRFLSLVPAMMLMACVGDSPVSVTNAPGTGPSAGPGEQTPLILRGAYVAQTYCGSCHGDNLRGGVTADTINCPALSAAVAYSSGQFKALLTDGVERDGTPRNGSMQVPPSMTDADREALHAYLRLLFENK